MPRLQQFSPIVRQLVAPRAPRCQQCFRFSTASRQYSQQSSTPVPPQEQTATPEQAKRAADLAAAEALTEGDSGQPPEPKPTLPSKRTQPSRPRSPRTTTYQPAAPPSPAELPPAKYQVSRSFSKNLPVYSDTKRGGNLKQTVVRRTAGDVRQLKDELRIHLSKKEEDVTINQLTQHVIIKGHHVEEVKAFLAARGM